MLARQLAGILAVEHQAQRPGCSPRYCCRSWLGEQILLGAHAGGQLALASLDPGELAAHCPLLGGKLEQAPIGLADRALRFTQRVGGLGLRALRFGKLLLQALDAAAQLFQVICRSGCGGGRNGQHRAETGRQRWPPA